jgi:hypothetical protein
VRRQQDRSRLRRVAVALAALGLGGCDGTLTFGDAPPASEPEAGTGEDARAPTAEGGAIALDVVIAEAGGTVGCTGDNDCVLASLRCDRVSGACVPCLADTDCSPDAGAPRCDTALHRCVQCGLASDCASVDTCEPMTHKCLHQCNDNKACSGPYSHCDLGRGWCVECATNTDCDHPWDKRVCELTSGQCVQCARDLDCAQNRPRCDQSVNRCVECLSQGDCAPGQICDPEGSACIAR